LLLRKRIQVFKGITKAEWTASYWIERGFTDKEVKSMTRDAVVGKTVGSLSVWDAL
jgi:hypothetical protein